MNAPLRVHNIQTLLGQVVVPSVAFGVAVLATFWSPLVVFNVTVSTERLELAIEDESGINWSFRDARLADTFGKPFPFSGSLHLAGPAFIVVRRVGLGPVVIDVESHGDSVGILYPSDDDERLPQDMGPRKAGFLLSIELGDLPRRAADGETMVLPFVGKAEVGRAIGYESGGFPGILRGGKVALLSGTLLSDGVYEAGSAILDSGDHIAFPGATNARRRLCVSR